MCASKLKMKGVACFGDCNIDLITTIPSIPVLGGCVFSDAVHFNVGGTVLNTVFALRHLGIDVSMISKVGDDVFGKYLMRSLQEKGFNLEYVSSSSDYPTGVTIGLVEPGGEIRWISARLRAADKYIFPSDLECVPVPEILYISGVAIVEGVETRTTITAFARHVKAQGGTVVLDPNIRTPELTIDDEVRTAFLAILPSVDVLVANEAELAMLSGSKEVEISREKILGLGVSTVWEKRGDKGARLLNAKGVWSFPASEVRAVDASGAGDAFNAAIIFSMLNEFSDAETGVFANLFAGYTVRTVGTTNALPPREVIKEMIQQVTGIDSAGYRK